MLLKRYLVLAVGVLLFIATFIVYFTFVNAQIEGRFHDERVKYGVDNAVLTTNEVASAAPAAPSAPPDSSTTTPPPAPASSTPDNPITTSSASPSAPIAPSVSATPPESAPMAPSMPPAPSTPAATPDTNMLIGPVPPPSTDTSSPATNAAPADTNAAPMPPSSTMVNPRMPQFPFLVMTSYHPGSLQMQAPGFEPPRAPTAPAPAPPLTISTPSTNTGAPAPAPANPTNAAAAAAPSGPARPVPVEASVIVLLYHQFVAPGVKVSPKLQWTMDQGVFASEMKYLHDNGYHVIPMSDLLRFLRHEIGLPPNSVVITIDDGYKSAIVYAAPILKQYGFPWTFFVYPDFITVNESKGAASWNDLLALQADGVDVECHSMTHPTLTKHEQKVKGVWHNFSPEEYDQWLTNETLGAKTLLEQKLGKPIISFAYPYGAYNKQVEAKVIAAGFQAIFTVADNPVHATTDMHSIGRYTITQAVEKNFTAYLHQGALGLADADPAPGATITNPRPVITAVLGYAGNLDPNSIETDVRDFGAVHHDFDPKTSTIRLYLPRDLVQPMNLVNIRVRDAQTGQVMVANWHFNYEPAGAAAVHPPIAATNNAAATAPTNAPSAVTNAAPAAPSAATPAPPVAAKSKTP